MSNSLSIADIKPRPCKSDHSIVSLRSQYCVTNMTMPSCIVAKRRSSFLDGSPENELHKTQDGDLLSELVHILCQGRLVIQHGLVLAAQLIILVQVASMETF